MLYVDDRDPTFIAEYFGLWAKDLFMRDYWYYRDRDRGSSSCIDGYIRHYV